MSPKALFLSHGGGPLPLLGDPAHQEMVACLQSLAASMPKPEAIVVISAHWEAACATIAGGSHPPLIYDYYGFPEESYRIQYPCPGEPELAARLQSCIQKTGLEVSIDADRGFDHGLFVPLKLMYPQADIPCVQLSLLQSLDPSQHIRLGRALSDLHSENVLVIGSGFSFHNMKVFFSQQSTEEKKLNASFEAWLADVCCNQGYSEQQRESLLCNWSEAEGARYCHPREEHLLPLHVCYGVAESACQQHFSLRILGQQASMYLW